MFQLRHPPRLMNGTSFPVENDSSPSLMPVGHSRAAESATRIAHRRLHALRVMISSEDDDGASFLAPHSRSPPVPPVAVAVTSVPPNIELHLSSCTSPLMTTPRARKRCAEGVGLSPLPNSDVVGRTEGVVTSMTPSAPRHTDRAHLIAPRFLWEQPNSAQASNYISQSSPQLERFVLSPSVAPDDCARDFLCSDAAAQRHSSLNHDDRVHPLAGDYFDDFTRAEYTSDSLKTSRATTALSSNADENVSPQHNRQHQLPGVICKSLQAPFTLVDDGPWSHVAARMFANAPSSPSLDYAVDLYMGDSRSDSPALGSKDI